MKISFGYLRKTVRQTKGGGAGWGGGDKFKTTEADKVF